MKKSSRLYLTLLLLVVAMGTTRCNCGQVDTSSGRCEGTVGGMQISAEIDPESAYYVDNSNYLDFYTLSYGRGQVVISAVAERGTVLTGGAVLTLPSELPSGCGPTDGGTRADAGTDGGTDGGADGGTDGGTDAGTGTPGGGCTAVPPGSPAIQTWDIRRPSPRPRLRTGTLERVLDYIEYRLTGTARMDFEDGSSLTCDFSLRHDDERDIGGSSGGGCGGGGGGGGDSDFD